jgi:hypothetical protein
MLLHDMPYTSLYDIVRPCSDRTSNTHSLRLRTAHAREFQPGVSNAKQADVTAVVDYVSNNAAKQ